MQRRRIQAGQVLRIGGNWHVRFWQRRTANGVIERKRVTHLLCAVSTRGKTPPADVLTAARQYMATVNDGTITPERIVTIGDFVQSVYMPFIAQHRRAGTFSNYRSVWRRQLAPVCGSAWLKDVRTYDVQRWLNTIAEKGLGRNSLKHVKSLLSGVFRLAKQSGYLDSINPVHESSVSATAEPREQYAYSPDEVQAILGLLPEPACTVFAVAAYSGLRIGEIAGLRWEDYSEGELHVTRSIWHGHISPPKTRKSTGTIPVIPQLRERLEMHRARSGNPDTGPIFRNSLGEPLEMSNLPRVIKPALKAGQWQGWHAARRGLGSNLYRLGVSELVIQRILRHANVATTTAYYVKTTAKDVRTAMELLENAVPKPLTGISGTVKPN